jgi:lipopolysaccharide export system protein LptA
MTRTVFALATAAAIAALAAASPAAAQLSQNGGPVSYSADNLQYFDTEHRLVLTGDVDVVQNDARLRADRITLFFSNSTASPQSTSGLGAGDIQRMLAEGEVYYVRPAQSARGDHADYEVNSDSVTFTGNVVVASTENVIRGDTLVLKISDRQTVIRPSAGGRVRGVFVPHSSDGATPAPAAPAPRH